MCVLISHQLLLLNASYLERFVRGAHTTNTYVVGIVNHSISQFILVVRGAFPVQQLLGSDRRGTTIEVVAHIR